MAFKTFWLQSAVANPFYIITQSTHMSTYMYTHIFECTHKHTHNENENSMHMTLNVINCNTFSYSLDYSVCCCFSLLIVSLQTYLLNHTWATTLQFQREWNFILQKFNRSDSLEAKSETLAQVIVLRVPSGKTFKGMRQARLKTGRS